MSGFHASSTRPMGNIWYVILAFLILFLFVGWKSVRAIEEIDRNSGLMSEEMRELMYVGH
ncbi:MAG: hypothetical protein AAB458_00735 [Patescibacteria group bacterium]